MKKSLQKEPSRRNLQRETFFSRGRVLLLLFLMSTFSLTSVFAQNQTVKLQLQNADVKTLLSEIKQQTGVNFVYNADQLRGLPKITLTANSITIKSALEQALKGSEFGFKVDGEVIVISKTVSNSKSSGKPISLKGTIIDAATKAPIPGATVLAKSDRTIGVASDVDGRYQIEIPSTVTVLTFSFVGYKTLELTVNPNDLSAFTTISLSEDAQKLDEVVVMGYGTQFKKNVTGSVAKVSDFSAEQTQVGNAVAGLQGRVAGLWVKSTSGVVGAEPQFIIRGMQTTDVTNAKPLIVIDGMIVDSKENFSMNNIAPQDIESIEVLKDAASSAMYGSRGAMGVIYITTKKGQKNRKPVVNVSAYYGIVSSQLKYRTLNNSEYEMIFREARENRIGIINDKIAGGGLTESQITTLETEKNNYTSQMNALVMGDSYTNWLDEIVPAHAAKSNIHVSLSGGTDKTTYYFSVGRNAEDNSVGKGSFDRLSTKLAITNQTYDWLKLSADISVARSTRKGFSSRDVSSLVGDIDGSAAINAAYVARPDMPIAPKYKADGSWDYYFGKQLHPLLVLNDDNNKAEQTNTTGNFSADIKLYKGLVWTSTFAGTISDKRDVAYESPLSYLGQSFKGYHNEVGNKGYRYTANSFLNYRVDIEQLNIAATLGYEFNENRYDGMGFRLKGFPTIDALYNPGNGASFDATTNKAANSRALERSESYFFRANLAYASKYLLSFSIRRDGTSKLAKEGRYSNFPAVSLGWVVSDEAFMKNQNVVSFLKLRSSYGLTGSIASVNMTDTYDCLTSAAYYGNPALTMGTALGNPDLKWEKTQQTDIGIDLAFFNSRLNLTAEWYYKKTDGMLNSETLPPTAGGFTSRKVNMGTIRNRGLDLDLSYKSDQQLDFTYELGVNMNINRSKILDLPVDKKTYGSYYPQSPMPKLKIGQPLGSLEMYQALGIDANGDVIYKDASKNGSIGPEDMVIINNVQPDFTGGLFLGTGYKGFSLYGQFSFTYGNKVYNYDDQVARNAGLDQNGVMVNMPEWVLDRWTPTNQSSRYPRMVVGSHGPQNVSGWNNYQSTIYLFDASYLRLKKVTLSYDIPQTWTSAMKMNHCKLYVSAENLWTVKNKELKMNDPEVATQTGIASQTIPAPISVLFGIDLTF